MTLTQKVAVVTGSTSGIGLGIARALAGAGADVVLNGFGDAAAIEELRAGLAAEFGVRVGYHGADLSKPAEIAALIGHAEETFGSVDVLVNNAGIQHVAPVEDFPADRWDAVIALNLSAVFHGTHHALPGMKRRGWGRILNIASVHGHVASVNKSAYVAAKHGVVGLTKTVALETASTGVTCNAICPGWVLTPLVQKQIDAIASTKNIPEPQAKAELLGAKQPSGAFVTPDELGGLAVFLCSDSAAQMTGASLLMDGGWTAQ
ncbi:3-hydroxybutyrate dehydrogenase [Azospirillum brasilense]|uniref:3-hydroxybutyrate dehydrogenase n=1 Tax=Azospirillum brasilense TaxID=192 RepID=Q8RPU5_AZOBR|nr:MULTISPECIES: 3-hydroxybutyrate dehydrogenase [Azospirillum]AAM00195.1 beta-hydroxybutyrate dehydrogenase [Azospirillum brasilense]ALJ36829.1 3-hydroxybutyrate dehydrogenase [Azospirillum brasilense]MDW7555871.1 3-hydroxybutyrate dehydrogenase [Azospirillum brasilense]MDW7595948.1 3-hydroxybutyrate dehydrogenase [Azospirillum brasilense]MDW7630953.1 3-hydroxybutyrate dehydrogenase [Azospirillum brasilense]